MIRLAAILCTLMVGPAYAGDTASWQGFTARIIAIDDGAHVADIDVWNDHTYALKLSEAELIVGDVSCIVTVTHRTNPAADTVSVGCAPGYIPVPAFIDVDELTSGRVAIFRADAVVGF